MGRHNVGVLEREEEYDTERNRECKNRMYRQQQVVKESRVIVVVKCQ